MQATHLNNTTEQADYATYQLKTTVAVKRTAVARQQRIPNPFFETIKFLKKHET